MTSQQMICPRSPVVGGDCNRHDPDGAKCNPHDHWPTCDMEGSDEYCGRKCIPYTDPASQPAKPDDKVPEPSDAERAAWPEATREYVDAIEIDNTAHGYSLSVVRRHFGLPEGPAYSDLCDAWDRLTAERDALRATITALNRRCQAAESLIAKSGIVEGRPQGEVGRSVGRALANYAAAKYERERDAERAECERLREFLRSTSAMAGTPEWLRQDIRELYASLANTGGDCAFRKLNAHGDGSAVADAVRRDVGKGGSVKRYAICRHGNKITVKRTDRNHDFGEVVNERETLPEAQLCAKVERMVLKRHFSNAPADLPAVSGKVRRDVGGAA